MRFFLITLFSMVLFSAQGHAEAKLGDSCSTYSAGTVQQSAGPELSGKAYLMACTGGIWVAAQINPSTDPCAGSPSVGAMCADGTLYVGMTPDGNVKMFAMPTDGPAGNYAWHNGSSNWGNDTSMQNCPTEDSPAASCKTGRANTTLLAALTGPEAPYAAATYCENLTAQGYSDWYLPALKELDLLSAMRAGGHGGMTNGLYWSSTEYGPGSAWSFEGISDTQDPMRVRCVRR